MLRSFVRATLIQPPPALRRAAWALVVALMILLLYLGAQPAAVKMFPANTDKLIHFLFFGGMAVLVMVGQGGNFALRAVMVTACLGLIDEFAQSFSAFRVVSVADWVMDVLGAIAAVFLVSRLQRWAQRANGQVAPPG